MIYKDLLKFSAIIVKLLLVRFSFFIEQCRHVVFLSSTYFRTCDSILAKTFSILAYYCKYWLYLYSHIVFAENAV